MKIDIGYRLIILSLLGFLSCFAFIGCQSKDSDNMTNIASSIIIEETETNIPDIESGDKALGTDETKSKIDEPEADDNEESNEIDSSYDIGENIVDKVSDEVEKDKQTKEGNIMKISFGDHSFNASFANNSSAEALKELLVDGPITVQMSDYGNMEKVGQLPISLPRNDQQITTSPGDIILYQGNALVIYYAPNTWNFTSLGKIDNVTGQQLLDAFGEGNVSVTLSLGN